MADTGLTAQGIWTADFMAARREAASSCSHTRTSTRSLFTDWSRVLNAGQSMDAARDISLSKSVIVRGIRNPQRQEQQSRPELIGA